MKKISYFKVVTILMSIPFIVACSGEPSEKDIKKAIQDSYSQETNSIFSSKIGEALLSSTGVKDIKLENIEKINCVSHAKNSYFCEYVMEYTIKADDGSLAEMFGAKGKKRSIMRSKFFKTSKSWIIADE
jgi:hypothetical protein